MFNQRSTSLRAEPTTASIATKAKQERKIDKFSAKLAIDIQVDYTYILIKKGQKVREENKVP